MLNSSRALHQAETPARTQISPFPLAIWSGIVAGLVEGFGLLLFQRIDWKNWGEMVHVSVQIIWISTAVNLILFSIVALVLSIIDRLAPRLQLYRFYVLIFAILIFQDWLYIPKRLVFGADFLLAVGLAFFLSRQLESRGISAIGLSRKTLPWVVMAGLLVTLSIFGGTWVRGQIPQAS